MKHIIIANGIYDVLCGGALVTEYEIPVLKSIHMDIFFTEYAPEDKRILGYWIMTYGIMRLSGDTTTVQLSYLIEAIAFLNELTHNRVINYKANFVIVTSLLMAVIAGF